MKLSTLGHKELNHMQELGQREVRCVNCSKLYHLHDSDFNDIHKIIDEKEKEKEKDSPSPSA